MPEAFFTEKERVQVIRLYRTIRRLTRDHTPVEQVTAVRRILTEAIEQGHLSRTTHYSNPIVRNLNTAAVICTEMGLRHASIISTMLYDVVVSGYVTAEDAGKTFGPSVEAILKGLTRANELYDRNAAIETENFRNLLLSFAQDGRVILIMIADRLNTMRVLKHYPENAIEKI
ncbi:MAG: bifunctional (p)ppGpp synthetase/guanosine-3',5'-bis(diphosphate) 3'-pyrophosphohydrolase, partial [Bacteroidales bacterium]|nr:bifunctional (p)ppGpp synthetase/guanosine-3',5'-bis(diphosphate) 3'-pyrophosphohydrolase [Bacteroidales bacterium]